MAKEPHGWCPDPFGVNGERFFSNGEPTRLVFDGTAAFLEPALPGVSSEGTTAQPPREAPVDQRSGPVDGAVLGSGRNPPAGWYRDPAGLADMRWWDGDRWTASVRPAPAPPVKV